MGLWLHTEDCEAEIDIGYMSFDFYRTWITECLNAEAGEIYKKPCRDISPEEEKRMEQLLPLGARIFLFHPDCEGELSPEECEKIVNDLEKVELRQIGMTAYAFKENKETWQSILDVLKYAATHRVKLCFD